MAIKVCPIRVKKMRVRDIPPGEIFSLNGMRHVMICPYNSYNEFAADVLAIINNECVKAIVLNNSVAFVRTIVIPRSKQKENNNFC